MGEGNAGVCGRSDSGGNSGDDSEGDVVLGEEGDFFPSASENHGVTSFESEDFLLFFCEGE